MATVDQAIDISAEERDTIIALLQRHLPDTAAWVYGSRANWTSRPQSDLDLVVFATPEQRRQVGQLREAFEESNLPFRVDLFVWDEIPDSFREQIERQHIPVVPPLGRRGRPGWRSARWGDLVTLEYGRALRTYRMSYGRFRVFGTNGPIGWHSDALSERATVIVGRKGAYRGIHYSRAPCFVIDTAFYLRPKADIDIRWAYYALLTQDINALDSGSAIPSTSRSAFYALPVSVPSLSEQRAIARVLGTVDDRIELNRRMNETLEAMARALFKSWFVDFDPVRAKMEGRDTGLPKDIADLFPDRLVDSELGPIPEGWRLQPLDSVARFQNGLALQKFRPAHGAARLPVVKIAQLRAGRANGEEWASAAIKPACVIDNGDVVFSWSGTLLVRTWCGGRAALNQHLFKVTSTSVPKWFYLHSILSHLPAFRRIAKDKATTMGHIKRHHLTDSLCVVPPDSVLTRVSDIFRRASARQVAGEVASQRLAVVRDALLPKLVSGELRTSVPGQLDGARTSG